MWRPASSGGSAAQRCGAALVSIALSGPVSGCGKIGDVPYATRGLTVATAPAPKDAERPCAWYGAAHEGVLYFGQSAFWQAMRRHDADPEADLRAPGPRLIGRFDLQDERLLDPLRAGPGGNRESLSGIWDVAMAANGWIYFTTFFEWAGRVDPASGRVETFPALGQGLSELAPGPDQHWLATRYGSGDDSMRDGSVVEFDAAGRHVTEWPIPAPAGFRSAPKSVAWSAAREELWVTTDLLPRSELDAIRHDAYVLRRDGESLRRISEPEIQFVTTGGDGTLFRAEVDDHTLSLHIAPPAPSPGTHGSERGVRPSEYKIVLDRDFPAGFDFVQDLQPTLDGRVVVTRWSGHVHVVGPGDRVATAMLPRLDPDGLYYTAVLHGDRLCATYCSDVRIVCVDAPR